MDRSEAFISGQDDAVQYVSLIIKERVHVFVEERDMLSTLSPVLPSRRKVPWKLRNVQISTSPTSHQSVRGLVAHDHTSEATSIVAVSELGIPYLVQGKCYLESSCSHSFGLRSTNGVYRRSAFWVPKIRVNEIWYLDLVPNSDLVTFPIFLAATPTMYGSHPHWH